MRDHIGNKRQFIQSSKAWYGCGNLTPGDSLKDVVTIGFYSHDGGTSGEFEIEWIELCGNIVPRLKAWDDGWSALYHFNDMLKVMASIDSENISVDDFCTRLEELGIENATPTSRE